MNLDDDEGRAQLERELAYLRALLETSAVEEMLGPQLNPRPHIVDDRDLSATLNAEINRAARNLFDRSVRIGFATVDSELLATAHADASEHLWANVAGKLAPNILPPLAAAVREAAHIRRRASTLTKAANAVSRGEDVSAEMLASELEQNERASTLTPHNARAMLAIGVRRYAELVDRRGNARVRTGIAEFDELLGGLDPGSLTVIGARPSVGKSSLALRLVTAFETENVRATIVSAEDGVETWATRLLAMRADVSASDLRSGKPVAAEEFARIDSASTAEGESFQLLEMQRGTLGEIVSALDSHARRHQSDVVLVDYAQAIRVPGIYDRRQQIDSVIGELKAACGRLGTHLILFSQLKRHDGEPTMEVLKESGTFEEAAENVLLLWRDREDGRPDSVYGRLAKNKNGRAGVRVKLEWSSRTASFGDIYSADKPKPSKLYDKENWAT